jgi:hypothetical protein
MVSFAGAAEAQLAVCAGCRQLWVLAPEYDRCLMCGGSPTHLLALPRSGLAGDDTSALPAGAGGPGPLEPVVFRGDCPHCGRGVAVTITEELVTFTSDEAEPAADDGDNSAPGSSFGEKPSAAEEDDASAAPTAIPPAAADASKDA